MSCEIYVNYVKTIEILTIELPIFTVFLLILQLLRLEYTYFFCDFLFASDAWTTKILNAAPVHVSP